MADIEITLRISIPEPPKDRKAQLETWQWINTMVEDMETSVAARGGTLEYDHKTRRGPRVTAPTPPPSASVPPQADMVDLAQIAAGVEQAAADPAPTKPERRAA